MTQKNFVLFEIGTEELPASEMISLRNQIKELTSSSLESLNIDFEQIRVYVTCRRIAFLIEGISEKQRDSVVLKKGPSAKIAYQDGKPTKALLGFLRSNGADESEITVKNGYVYLEKQVKGSRSEDVVRNVFISVISKLRFSKSMKWGSGKHEFIRPVKWINAMFNDHIVEFSCFEKSSGNTLFGHPHHNRTRKLQHARDYVEQMKSLDVLVDFDERKRIIVDQLKKIEDEHELKIHKDMDLIAKTADMTEWPAAVVGNFKDIYLTLPQELITVTIKHHLSGFTAERNGQLTRTFIIFADKPEADLENSVVHGYENVVNARLEDARYYLNLDLKHTLEEFTEKLKEIVFQESLGTLYDKVTRVKSTATNIAKSLSLPLEKVSRAAELSKSDIATHVVYEFPELQGTIGRIYALKSGEDADVATALEEQYSENPPGILGSIVGIADRIDTIVGNFTVGNIPSGSKDPFGLRSKADTIFRICVLKKWDLDIWSFMQQDSVLLPCDTDLSAVSDFMKSRFYAFLTNEQRIPFDVARTVLHLWNQPFRGIHAATSILKIKGSKDFQELVVGFERVHNITKSFESIEYDGSLFQKDAEKDLLNQFICTKPLVIEALEKLDYDQALLKLIELKPHIDRYFDEVFVMVNQEDIRRNRLAFLKDIDSLFMKVGDLTQLSQEYT